MKKILIITLIASMLCSTTGTTYYTTAKAAKTMKCDMEVVSDEAISKKDSTPTASTEENSSEEIVTPDAFKDFEITEDENHICIDQYIGNDSSVIIPNTYNGKKIEIDPWAFEECTSLEEVILPESLVRIPYKAFKGCSNLKKVQLPKSLVTIEWEAFEGCTSLEEIILPESLVHIFYSAFEGCSNLKKVQLPESLKEVDSSAFEGCTSLKEIILPKSLNEIDATSFQDTGLEEYTIDSNNPNFTVLDGVIYDKKCTRLVAVPPRKSKLAPPATVTSIDTCAAYGNTKLKEVTFPNALKKIDESAFEGCTSLKKVVIPASVTCLDGSSFFKCSSLKTFKVSNKNKKYSTSNGNLYNKKKTIFYASVTNKETITLAKTVKTLDQRCFFNCNGIIKKIKVEKGNTYYSTYDDVLYNKNKTRLIYCPEAKTSIILPSTVAILTDTPYDSLLDTLGGYDLKKIQVKSGNKYYSSYKGVLYNKKKTKMLVAPFKIKNIVLPKTVTDISALVSSIEHRPKDLMTITLDAGNKSFRLKNGVLYDYKLKRVIFCARNKKSVVLPKTVEVIEESAFYGCKDLETITFSDKLRNIEKLAFENCSKLEYVKLPDTGIGIEALAFLNCSSLRWIYVPKNYKAFAWDNDLFQGCTNLTDMYYAGNENEWMECEDWYGVYDEMYDNDELRYHALNNQSYGKPVNPTMHYNAKAPL